MQNHNNNIEQLLVACESGDNRAQLLLYKKYFHAMFNTSYRIVNDIQDAENIMQDSFLAAFTKLALYNGSSSFGAWLKRIVINKSISHLRKKKNYSELFDETMEIPDITYEDYGEKKYLVDEVVSSMYELKENYRIPLSLNLLEGYDYEEISEILGITNQNSRTIVSRAKTKLREMIIKKTTYNV